VNESLLEVGEETRRGCHGNVNVLSEGNLGGKKTRRILSFELQLWLKGLGEPELQKRPSSGQFPDTSHFQGLS
jgi:hypothetical protein